MARQDKKCKPCAIVVSYEPDTKVLLALLEQIGAQADFLLIDNGSSNRDEFIGAVGQMRGCINIHALDENIGLASAMNLGLRGAKEAAYAYAVLFDQDSQVPKAFFANMQMAFVEAQRLCHRPVAAIGPSIVSLRDGTAMPFKLFSRVFKRSNVRVNGSERLFKAEFLISSGCFIAMESLGDVGEMKEAYFIDNIDLEWCFRARAKGYEILGTDLAQLHHSIGVDDDSVLVRRGVIVSHSPLRSYYSTRNRFALYREKHAPLAWKLRDLPRFVLKTLWLLVFSQKRAAYAQNIWRGIRDSRGLSE